MCATHDDKHHTLPFFEPSTSDVDSEPDRMSHRGQPSTVNPVALIRMDSVIHLKIELK